MKNIGIIGASGFIGSNLRRFLETETSITTHVISRAELEQPSIRAHFVNHCDALVYLAHEGGPNQHFPIEVARQKNIPLLKQVIGDFKKPRPFVYLSSGGTVYGNSTTHTPWKETDLLHPPHSYAEVKVEAEKILEKATQEGRIQGTVLRAANPYGNFFTHAKPQGVIDVIVSCLISEKAFTLFDPVTNVRDFLHMQDLNRAILTAARRDYSGFQIYNVGSGKGTSLQAIIEKIQTISGKTLQLTVKEPEGGAHSLPWNVLDISKIISELGWTPKISLDEGLKELIQRKMGSLK